MTKEDHNIKGIGIDAIRGKTMEPKQYHRPDNEKCKVGHLRNPPKTRGYGGQASLVGLKR